MDLSGITQNASVQNTTSQDSTAALATTPEATGVAVGSPGGELGKNEFLNLLATEMRNQDPLNPMENTELVAQLAQFSALEQMQNLNAAFTSFRQDSSFAMSYMMSGQDIALQLKDGTTVEGTVEKVLWQNGEMIIQIDGMGYPMSDIYSIAKPQEEAEQTASIEMPDESAEEAQTIVE